MTRVVLYPNRLDAMGYYRMIWPGQALQAAGYDVVIPDVTDPARLQWWPDENGNLRDFTTPDADVIVIQRCTQRLYVQAIELWQSRGIRVVMDLDDDFRAIDQTANPAAKDLLHHRGSEIGWQHTDRAAKLVDGLVVSTPQLRKSYGRGTVVRNHIPRWYLSIPHDLYRVENVFGWTGSLKLRRTDPEVVGRSFAALQREGYVMGMIGDRPELVQELFRLDSPPRTVGMLPIDLYPQWMSRFSVGVVPLKDNAFNLAKSWLKGLEFAAVGVPYVSSPHPEYAVLGAGLTAGKPREWHRKVKRLLDDDAFNAEMSANGRELASCFVIEDNADLWWRAWTQST